MRGPRCKTCNEIMEVEFIGRPGRTQVANYYCKNCGKETKQK